MLAGHTPTKSTPFFQGSTLAPIESNILLRDRDSHFTRIMELAGVLDVASGAWLCPIEDRQIIGGPVAHVGLVPWPEIARSIDRINADRSLAMNIDHVEYFRDDEDHIICPVGDGRVGRGILFLRQRIWHPSISGKLEEAVRKIRDLLHTVWIMHRETNMSSLRTGQAGSGLATREGGRLADQCPFGIMVLDVDQYIHMANGAAQRLLKAAGKIGAVENRLTIGDSHDAIRFQVTLRAILLDNVPAPSRRTLAVAGPDDSPLLLSVSRLSDGGERPRACVIITRPGKHADPDVLPLAELFGLTPVETRLVCELVRGLNLQEASRALRLKVQTVRTYLKQIFQKTGTHRQVELVQLMQNGALPILD